MVKQTVSHCGLESKKRNGKDPSSHNRFQCMPSVVSNLPSCPNLSKIPLAHMVPSWGPSLKHIILWEHSEPKLESRSLSTQNSIPLFFFFFLFLLDEVFPRVSTFYLIFFQTHRKLFNIHIVVA